MAKTAVVRKSNNRKTKGSTGGGIGGPSPTDKAFTQIVDLGLGQYIAELENYGFTVIPPNLSGGKDLVKPLLQAIKRIATERNGGVKPDFKTGDSHSELLSPAGQHLFFLLGEDPVFQQAMMNPVVVAFVKYLVSDPIISSVTSMLKGPGVVPLPLHSDQPIHPIPRSLVCNATYLLTDYSRDNGAICFIPGSQKLMRQPGAAENFSFGDLSQEDLFRKIAAGKTPKNVNVIQPPNVQAVEAKKGSLVVWQGNTWHGAFNRINSGLRANLILYWCSAALRPQEPYREQLSDEVIAANGEEFAQLIGKNIHNGWMSEGPEYKPGIAFETHRKRSNANSVPA